MSTELKNGSTEDVLREAGFPCIDLAAAGARLFPGDEAELQMRDMRSRVRLAGGILNERFDQVSSILQGMDELSNVGFRPDINKGIGAPAMDGETQRLIADFFVFDKCGAKMCLHGIASLASWSKQLRPEADLDEQNLNVLLAQTYAALCIVRVADFLRSQVEQKRNDWGYPERSISAWFLARNDLRTARADERDLISIAVDYKEPHFAWIAKVPAALNVMQTFFRTIDPQLVEGGSPAR